MVAGLFFKINVDKVLSWNLSVSVVTAANSHSHAHSLRVQYYVNHVRRTNVQHRDTKSSNHSKIISHNVGLRQ